MLLQDWLARNNLTYGQFGAAISRTAEAVRRYANGERIPDREAMIAIARETGDQVTPNDFYGLVHAPADTATPAPASPGQCVPESPSIGEAA
jgi:hypothetical protein